MKQTLSKVPVYTNTLLLIVLVSMILLVDFFSIDFRVSHTKTLRITFEIIITFFLVLGVAMNLKKIKMIFVLVCLSVINYYLMVEFYSSFIPW